MTTATLRVARPWAARIGWERAALLGVLSLAAVLCLWNLTISGYSNEYYAAAAKAGSVSWKAWFFGALDPGSFITVDKPPLSLWLMGLSARVFGFSSFSLLLPQALCTIAAVGLLHATVRRAFGAPAALMAAGALALTPITVAIARVNNPDALLVLLMVASAYLTVRAIESGRTKHLAWAGALVGLAFMTKMLQGWMIVPALGAAYLLAGPPRLLTRMWQLAVAGATMVAVSAAWPVAVALWPGDTPYIGGSTDGTVLDLVLGYNGFGRLTGNEGGRLGGIAGGGGGGPTFGGESGLWRMFNAQVGGQVAWLLPLAAVGLGAGLWLTRRAPRTDVRRGAWVLFGVWALVHVAVFSSQKGIFHPYYVSALAPAVAALAAGGVAALVPLARRSWAAAGLLAASVAGTAGLSIHLLARTPDFAPWTKGVVFAAAALAIAGVVVLRTQAQPSRAMLAAAAVAGAIALAAGPAAYSVANLGHKLNGNDVTAGPASAGGGFGPGGGRRGGMPSGGTASNELIRYLQANQGSAKYLVAATGSMSSAPIILATGEPVVTIGGFNGGDPAPTAAQLAALVESGQLKFVLLGGGGGPGGGGPRGGAGSDVTAWVQANGTAVDGVTSGSGTLYRVGS
jgi:4-amino-4-deoxy-L-arabinose transferase-like glycosyltransferase